MTPIRHLRQLPLLIVTETIVMIVTIREEIHATGHDQDLDLDLDLDLTVIEEEIPGVIIHDHDPTVTVTTDAVHEGKIHTVVIHQTVTEMTVVILEGEVQIVTAHAVAETNHFSR